MTGTAMELRHALSEDDTSITPNGKTGTLLTTIGTIFCAIVGAGVLGLPNAVAWWGWVAGPLLMILFFLTSIWTSLLLASVYRVGDIEHGRFYEAVYHILGNAWGHFASSFQFIYLVLITLAYTITGGMAMSTAAEKMGSGWTKTWQLTLVLGGLEVALSQIPNLEETWWATAIGALCSLTYCGIALIMGCIYAGNRLGSVSGNPGSSPADKAFNMLSSLGSLAFAFSFSMVLLEIQHCLRQPPNPVKTMKKAIKVAVTGAFAFYFTVACTGYAALGVGVPGEVLEGFEHAPAWPMAIANLAVAIHMITAIQIFTQPIFHTIEGFFLKRKARRQQLHKVASSLSVSTTDKLDKSVASWNRSHDSSASQLPMPFDCASAEAVEAGTGPATEQAISDTAQSQALLPFWQRFTIRTSYVVFMVLVSILMPFFTPVIGLVGSVTFWPVCVMMPSLMYVRVFQPRGFQRNLLLAVNALMAVVSLGALAGSARSLVLSWSSGFQLFQ